MRRSITFTTVALGMLLLGIPAAEANSDHYVGSCTVDAWNAFAGFNGSGRTRASCNPVQVRTHMFEGVGEKTEFDGDVTKPDVGLGMTHTDHNWNPGTGWVGFPLDCC